MGGPPPCDECEAILRELREAYASAWASSDQQTRDAWLAFARLTGGTEQDAERAEELAPRAKFQDPLRVNRALARMSIHQARTGHSLLRRLRGEST
ncbi:MAG TPA: hypothetical protein VGS20_17220 [Candidatus Acidoferrales bacterium]|nr:hypothetical protein [Candidatus Acidoferrales bacterium]